MGDLPRLPGAEAPPATPAVVAEWMRSVSSPVPRTLTARLSADPWLDALLPAVFELPGLGGCLDEAWPRALARLATTGRIDRAALLRLVLHRLREGDKPGALRPILEIHRLLDPSLAERAARVPDYLALLGSPLAVASVGQRALRLLDDAGRLDPSILAEATSTVLARPDTKLVRAQLSWLEARSEVGSALLTAAASGLPNPRIDLAEQVLRLLTALPGGLAVVRSWLPRLDGDLRRQASEALGLAAAPSAPSFAPAPRPYAPGPMPPPAAGPDLAALMRSPLSPLDLERVLAGLVRADADAALLPLLPGLAPSDGPLGLLGARVAELAAQFESGHPPPFLLAFPARADGHVDPARVVLRLAEADADGWQPGRFDLAQALLRLPRRIDASVGRAANRLSSPAGRRFAAWLRDGGLPDPAMTVTVVPGPPARRVAVHARLGLPSGPLDPPAFPVTDYPDRAGWPMVLPGHREIVAAHCQPFLAPEHRGGTDLLPELARMDGPFGPAMALCLAYGLSARYDEDRHRAVEALLHLAATGGVNAPLVGHELGRLLTAGGVVLSRVVPALDEARRDGAPHVVWAIARTLVPVLLRMDRLPQATPDLLSLAAAAAAATGAHADLPDVTTLAARPGHTRLITEAARLARTVAD